MSYSTILLPITVSPRTHISFPSSILRWAPAQSLKGKAVPLYLNKVYQSYFTSDGSAAPPSSRLRSHSRRMQHLPGSLPSLGLHAVPGADENHTISILRESVVVAYIISMPKVETAAKTIYMTATPELRINGTGLIGARSLALDFSPPLKAGEDYEFTSKFPLVEDTFSLRLIKGKHWRPMPGDLLLTQIDTGAGPVLVNGSGINSGVLVAVVKTDASERWGQHPVWVENTAAKQLVYHDESSVIISGDGFNPHSPGTAVKFSNGLSANDYTAAMTTETQIMLKLRYGHFWFQDLEALPAALTGEWSTPFSPFPLLLLLPFALPPLLLRSAFSSWTWSIPLHANPLAPTL